MNESHLQKARREAEAKGFVFLPRHETSMAQLVRNSKSLDEAVEYLFGYVTNIRNAYQERIDELTAKAVPEGYQYEIMDRTHIICELIDSALLNNAGITTEQAALVESALDILGQVYQDAGAKTLTAAPVMPAMVT